MVVPTSYNIQVFEAVRDIYKEILGDHFDPEETKEIHAEAEARFLGVYKDPRKKTAKKK